MNENEQVIQDGTTSDYLQNLVNDRDTLVTNLVAKGVEASNVETFTELVPKVAELPNVNDDINDYIDNVLPESTVVTDEMGYISEYDSVPGWLKTVKNWAHYTNVTTDDYTYLFANFPFNVYVDLSAIDFNTATSIDRMFLHSKLTTPIDLSQIDLSSIPHTETFVGAHNSTINLSNQVFDTSYETEYVNQTIYNSWSGDNLILNNIKILNGDMESLFSSIDPANIEISLSNDCPTIVSTNSAFNYSGKGNRDWNTGKWSDEPRLDLLDLSNIDLSNVNTAMQMFQGTNFKEVNLGNLGANVATLNMSSMFSGCNISKITLPTNFFNNKTCKLNSIFSYTDENTDISILNTNITSADMSEIFRGHWGKEIILPNFNCTSSCYFRWMFVQIKSFYVDISGFSPAADSDLGRMFEGCSNLQHIDIRSIDFSHGTRSWIYTTNGFINGSPLDCEIVVKDATEKAWFQNKWSSWTNVMTAEEYDAKCHIHLDLGDGTSTSKIYYSIAVGDTTTLPVSADITPPDGKVFDHWEDSEGNTVTTFTATTNNSVEFTAVYTDANGGE